MAARIEVQEYMVMTRRYSRTRKEKRMSDKEKEEELRKMELDRILYLMW